MCLRLTFPMCVITVVGHVWGSLEHSHRGRWPASHQDGRNHGFGAANPTWQIHQPDGLPPTTSELTLLPDRQRIGDRRNSGGDGFNDTTAPVYPSEMWNHLYPYLDDDGQPDSGPVLSFELPCCCRTGECSAPAATIRIRRKSIRPRISSKGAADHHCPLRPAPTTARRSL